MGQKNHVELTAGAFGARDGWSRAFHGTLLELQGPRGTCQPQAWGNHPHFAIDAWIPRFVHRHIVVSEMLELGRCLIGSKYEHLGKFGIKPAFFRYQDFFAARISS